jgi:hypothetical protein
MPPSIHPNTKAKTSNSIVSTYLGLDIEFSFNVVLNQAVLDHGDQIAAAVFWTDESHWALAPATSFQELGIESSVILVVGVKGHQGP